MLWDALANAIYKYVEDSYLSGYSAIKANPYPFLGHFTLILCNSWRAGGQLASRRATGGIAIQWRSSVARGDSDIYYKCWCEETQACFSEEVLTSLFIIFLQCSYVRTSLLICNNLWTSFGVSVDLQLFRGSRLSRLSATPQIFGRPVDQFLARQSPSGSRLSSVRLVPGPGTVSCRL